MVEQQGPLRPPTDDRRQDAVKGDRTVWVQKRLSNGWAILVDIAKWIAVGILVFAYFWVGHVALGFWFWMAMGSVGLLGWTTLSYFIRPPGVTYLALGLKEASSIGARIQHQHLDLKVAHIPMRHLEEWALDGLPIQVSHKGRNVQIVEEINLDTKTIRTTWLGRGTSVFEAVSLVTIFVKMRSAYMALLEELTPLKVLFRAKTLEEGHIAMTRYDDIVMNGVDIDELLARERAKKNTRREADPDEEVRMSRG